MEDAIASAGHTCTWSCTSSTIGEGVRTNTVEACHLMYKDIVPVQLKYEFVDTLRAVVSACARGRQKRLRFCQLPTLAKFLLFYALKIQKPGVDS